MTSACYRVRVGLAERITDQQLRRARGPRAEVLRQARRRNRLSCWLIALNAVAVAAGLAGRDSPVRTFWAFMGILWVAFAYMIFRQRRHLTTFSDEEG